jgi:hypothetical protein
VTVAAGLIDGRDDAGLPFGHAAVELAFRAREGLRRTFISKQLRDAIQPRSACQTARENLGAYVRVRLSNRDTTRVSAHLECCGQCTTTYLELVDVVSRPRPARSRTAHTILG